MPAPAPPRHLRLQSAIIALGLSELYGLLAVAPLVQSRHAAGYHWHGSGLALFLPVFLDLALLWAIFTLALTAVARASIRSRVLTWAALLLPLPAAVTYSLDLLQELPGRAVSAWLLAAAVVLWIVLAIFSANFRFTRFLEATRVLLLCFGFGGAILLAQLIFLAVQARSLNQPRQLHTAQASAPAQPRVVWIVFDELSYLQVYDRRFPGLRLPAFDALAAQSVVFTHARPAGIFTDRVLPSLLTGEPVDLVQASPDGYLYLHTPGAPAPHAFDPHNTVFQDALSAGYSTAVAGWYIPYCRILPTVLDRCFWDYNIKARNGMYPRASIPANMLAPLAYAIKIPAVQRVLARLFPGSPFAISDNALHIESYRSITAAANTLVADPSATFVLLHLPIPHLGGIYNRRTGQLTTTGPSTYLDNLALADRTLGSLRDTLIRTGQWDATTIIVMGDHSWRTTQLYKSAADWTTEEEQASHGGQFDDRPAYIVKLAHQQTPTHIDTPFPAIETRHLLDAILTHQVTSPDQLSSWVDQRPAR